MPDDPNQQIPSTSTSSDPANSEPPEQPQPPISPEPPQPETPQVQLEPTPSVPEPQVETPPQQTQLPPSPQPQPQIIEKEVIKEVPVEVIKEVIKEVPVEVIKEVIKEVPVEKEVIKEVIREVPRQVEDPEFNRRVEEKLQERLTMEAAARRKLAIQARIKKKEDNLNKTLEFVRARKIVTTSDIKGLLGVSQSTAVKYLKELVRRGALKQEGERGRTKYSA